MFERVRHEWMYLVDMFDWLCLRGCARTKWTEIRMYLCLCMYVCVCARTHLSTRLSTSIHALSLARAVEKMSDWPLDLDGLNPVPVPHVPTENDSELYRVVSDCLDFDLGLCFSHLFVQLVRKPVN